MAIPEVEFRTYDISLSEPADRTTAGSIIDINNPLDFGIVNNTGSNANAGPRVCWFRAKDLKGNASISNMKFFLSQNSIFEGTGNEFYLDITSVWTQNKSVGEVSSGNPGICPQSEPSSNLQRMNGGAITGTGHNDTSQYIYLAININKSEPVGSNKGLNGGFKFCCKFDYSA
ncbi:hypothetical protein DRQ09_02460 [candidate division KSB1 bacterium]|nr:MAG: hypothetical protein DRQ09_02460 [candidate division KSB1 bacterium]